jgi:hypothetical protein
VKLEEESKIILGIRQKSEYIPSSIEKTNEFFPFIIPSFSSDCFPCKTNWERPALNPDSVAARKAGMARTKVSKICCNWLS